MRTVTSALCALMCLAAANGQDSSPAKLFPASTIVYAELNDPEQLVATIFDHPLRAKIESLEPYRMATQTPAYRTFQVGRAFVETHFGMSWRQGIATLAQDGVCIGYDAAAQGAVVVLDGKDEETMTAFRDRLVELAQMGDNRREVKSGQYRGVTAHQIDQTKFAVWKDRMVVTDQADLGQAVLDRLIDGRGDSLADNPRFQAARADRQNKLTAWAFVDIETIRESGVADDLYQNQIDNPVLELLLGGIQSTMTKTPYLVAGLSADVGGLGLRLSMPHQVDWIPEQREYYFGPQGMGRAPVLPDVNQTLFSLSTYRNFSDMWLRAGDLYGQRINDEFAKADANLTTLFAGRDFGEDILGSLKPEVGLIATRHPFGETTPVPTIKLPAFALVLELKEPETMTRELRRIFQSLVGFLNVVGAMNGQNQLELDMEKLDSGVELVSSTFVPEEDERESTQADIIFNFSPTVGFSQQRFVISSTKSLAKELIMAKPVQPATSQDNTHTELRADVLRNILHDNRGQLIAQNMLEDGNSREEAEAIIDLLLEVVGYFDGASLRLGADEKQLEVEFAIAVKS
ncbi:MAG: hypothetical protein MI861_04555 [Pirellulales bacterium]|nr:hypothetical protein [Pirellulales bacterium]